MKQQEYATWVKKEKRKSIFHSINWFLLVNVLYAVFLLVHFFNVNLLLHPMVSTIVTYSLVVLVALHWLKTRNETLAWRVLVFSVFVLTFCWCVVFYHLLSINDMLVVFPLSLALLFSSLIPFYLSPGLFFLFTAPLLAIIIIGNVVLRDAATISNIVAYALMLFIMFSAKKIMERWFLLAVERERENKTLIERLSKLASKDPLTGISNRRYFNNYFESVYSREVESQGRMAVLLIDVDFFKKYNDHYGHQTGDECLIKIADCLENCTRRSQDLVARYGGEEFIILLPKSGREQALAVAERVKEKIAKLAIPHEKSDVAATVTVSQGIAEWRAGLSREQLVEFADRALYQVKAQGRDNFALYVDDKRDEKID